MTYLHFGQSEEENFKEYQAGRVAAFKEMAQNDFDVVAALTLFERDPADTPFQLGYLRELEEKVSGHA